MNEGFVDWWHICQQSDLLPRQRTILKMDCISNNNNYRNNNNKQGGIDKDKDVGCRIDDNISTKMTGKYDVSTDSAERTRTN